MSLRQNGASLFSQAPTRLDFAGGPTDLTWFAQTHGGRVINQSLAFYAKCWLLPRKDSQILIRSTDLCLEQSFKSIDEIALDGGPLDLLKAAILHTASRSGMSLVTQVDVPHGSGLGASASLSVAVLKALYRFNRQKVSRTELAQHALLLENEMLGNSAGGQDQYAAALGGCHAFDITSKEWTIRDVVIREPLRSSLERDSLLVFSGESHLSGCVLDDIRYEFSRGNQETIRTLKSIRKNAIDTENALTIGDRPQFVNEMKRAFEYQCALHPSLVTAKLRKVEAIAIESGAQAVKVLGAGGGGFMLVVSPPNSRAPILSIFKETGYVTLPVKWSKNLQ